VRVIFTPLAERHIDSWHEYIAMHASDGARGRLCRPHRRFLQRALHISAEGNAARRSLSGLRVTGFERRVTIAFIVTADAVLIEGIFYGGRDFEAVFAIAREIYLRGNSGLSRFSRSPCEGGGRKSEGSATGLFGRRLF
jgi:toxin ParE1/3/4